MSLASPSIVSESMIKDEMLRITRKYYPTSHAVVIPSSKFRLLPYDIYFNWKGILRAVELKVDSNPVMAHQYQSLYEVVATRGYAFVVRWMNKSGTMIVENYSNGDVRNFKELPTSRDMRGDRTSDDDTHTRGRSVVIRQTVEYIMGFDVSPMESQIQEILARDYKKGIREKLSKIGS